MMVNKSEGSYYGQPPFHKPIRSLVEDLVIERKKQMVQDFKSMEDRLKRHITECKREIIKELMKQIQLPSEIKEQQHGCKSE